MISVQLPSPWGAATAVGGDVGPGASAGGANPAAFLLFVVGLAVLALRRFRTAEV